MKAVVVRRGEQEPRVVERPRPAPAAGEALVRILRVGVDGTDREVIRGTHGGFPAGADELVLGHEAVGVVADANGTDLPEGTVVVPTVRVPADGGDRSWFERGSPDMAPWNGGDFHERGIAGADGYMAEYVTCPAEALVPVPEAQAATGFLVEPLSIAVKAVEHAAASRSAFDWRPESAIVLGNGSLGLLTLGLLDADERFDRLYCLGRRDRPDPTIDVIEGLGATYVDSRETPVAAIPDEHEPMDLVFEATGYPRHAVETLDALAPGGVGALLGVPEDWEMDVDAGRLHREMVLDNKALVGSVNSNRDHVEAASERLAGLPRWLIDRVVTGVYPPERLAAAFADDDTTIKTAVELGNMKNVDDLIASAGELAAGGLSRGEIADELNVSRETASWLVERSDAGRAAPAGPDPDDGSGGPDDIHVDWSTIGRDSARLGYVAGAMADLLSKQGEEVDLSVGIEKAGVPLATAVARDLDTDLATYAPAKHQWEEGDMEDLGGSFSRNFAEIRGRDCYVVDDTITSGTTMRETVEAVRAEGGNPVACCVVVDKQGVESIDGVPVYSLVTVVRVGDD